MNTTAGDRVIADSNAELRTHHEVHKLHVLVLCPHNRCNCRCVMCDIWRIRQAREITPADLEPHLESFLALQIRWVVLSGGEPQMHSDLAGLCKLFRAHGIRITLLTAGLLLEPYAGSIVNMVDDFIVSLDGPPEIHNQIRRVPRGFDLLARGIAAVRKFRPQATICGRSTVQKANFRYLREAVRTARQVGLNSISFLAADLTSQAFNRPAGWPAERQQSVALSSDEVDGLNLEVEALIREHADDLARRYITESPEKLRRIVLHFRAHLGQAPAAAPRCNAPWVSAVIETDGTVRPCFFHPAIGNIHESSLGDALNSERAIRFRENLDVSNNPVCRRCVCSLYVAGDKMAERARP
jgi:Fe-coproporphyrin III synthase